VHEVEHAAEAVEVVAVAVEEGLATTVGSPVTCRGTARRRGRRGRLARVVVAEGRATNVARRVICHVTVLIEWTADHLVGKMTASATTVAKGDICLAIVPRLRGLTEGVEMNVTHVEALITSNATAQREPAVRDLEGIRTFAATTAMSWDTSQGTVLSKQKHSLVQRVRNSRMIRYGVGLHGVGAPKRS